MSGGHFDYAYQRVQNFADDLESQLGEYDENSEMYDALRAVMITSRYTARMMKAAEWLYSGDIGEDTFIDRLGAIITEMEQTSYELNDE